MAIKNIEAVVEEIADLILKEIRWTGVRLEDLILQFEKGGGGAPEATKSLLASWVTRLRINLDFKDLQGGALVHELAIAPKASGGYEISIEFAGAPEGSLFFACEEYEIHP